MRPGSYRFIGPLTLAQKRRGERNRRTWDRIADVAYTFNVSIPEAMRMISYDRKYGEGLPNRLTDYLV